MSVEELGEFVVPCSRLNGYFEEFESDGRDILQTLADAGNEDEYVLELDCSLQDFCTRFATTSRDPASGTITTEYEGTCPLEQTLEN